LRSRVSPSLELRLRERDFTAPESTMASDNEGTSRWGMTEVYQDPGPRVSTSASLTASTLSYRAGGDAGWRHTISPYPTVEASTDCPRTTWKEPGNFTSASIVNGTDDIGSTRPWARSSRAIQSSPATWSPWICHRAAMSRLPTAWPDSSPSDSKRC